MQFQPKTKEELVKSNAFALIPKGVYDAECTHADEGVSQKGSDMFVIQWNIYVDDTVRVMKDYIVPSVDMHLDKLCSLCASVGLSDDYEAGNLDPDSLIGQGCKVSIVQKMQKDGEYKGKMQNQIAAYMHPKATDPAASNPTPAKKGSPADEEDSPFK